MESKGLSSYLESTLLTPVASAGEITELCNKALLYEFKAVCVHPFYVPLAASLLSGSSVKVVTVVGFPLGANDYRIKAREAELAVKNGADEIDMVINLAAVKSGDSDIIKQEVSAVAATADTVKAIIETGYFNNEEILMASSCINEGGAQFVKTCTGFGPRGVKIDDIILLRSHLPPEVGIKAAAGIKKADFALALIDAGATRIGTSAAESIVEQHIV